MKVLILLSSGSDDGFLVKLHTEELVREIKKYIFRRNNSKAMMTALTKGKIEREVSHGEAKSIAAELILTKERACWNPIK